MTEHPEELLAAYVDGDLDAADRRVVQAHVRSCARCRDEARMARAARDALASLPEEAAPEGTAFRVLRAAPRGEPASGRVWRIATAAGIAASLVLGAVVVFQRVDLGGGAGQAESADAGASRPTGQDQTEEDAEGEAAAPQAAGTAEDALMVELPQLVSRSASYDSGDMPRVLRRLERKAEMLVADAARATETSFLSAVEAEDPRTAAALECASSAIRAATEIEDPGVPFVFEKAAFFDTFAGRYVPGYVAAYLDAPAPEAEPTSLFMTVVDRETCDRLLYFTPPVEL